MTVVAHDPFLEESPVPGVGLIALDVMLPLVDVVSLHAPALPSTERLINADTLARMKPGSYLVNCARGALVDQDALVDALDRGHLAGAGLDVTVPEPLPVGHPLLGRDDVIVTPHVASGTGAGRRRLYEHAIDNALAILRGEPATVVEPPSL
jgi:D-3-phosphoglycerate dehydrogenase